MSSKEQTQDRVNKLVARWKPRLLFSDWGVIIDYADKDKETNVTDGTRRLTLADMTVNQAYTDIRLTIYPAFFKEPAGSQEATIVHELCHIVTQPVREALSMGVNKGAFSEKKAVGINENITEKISKMLLRAYKRKSAGYHL